MSNPIKKCAPPIYDEKGRLSFAAHLTSEIDKDRVHCFIPADRVIPVLFVPGIMGSNLRVTGQVPQDWGLGPIAWRPDDGAGTKLSGATSLYAPWASDNFVKLIKDGSPGLRQRLLVPMATAVDDRAPDNGGAELPDQWIDPLLADFKLKSEARDELRQNHRREYVRRGWTTVLLSCYGQVLSDLELRLNRIYFQGALDGEWSDLLDSQGGKAWGSLKDFKKLTEGDLKHGANFWYPVHAVGYNWLRSNAESGEYLAGRIRTTIAHYQSLGYKCSHAVLVTHSMGGLVARGACHASMGKAQGQVLGVVHGEMPATGAPATYKRMRAGFEGTAKAVLGKDAANVTAVLAHAPGGLELLPSQHYKNGKPWLFIDQDDKKNSVLALPAPDPKTGASASPYAQIYMEEKAWWRLLQVRHANPDNGRWLPPNDGRERTQAEILAASQNAWISYTKALTAAESYHSICGEYYHPQTYGHYGCDHTGTTDVFSGYNAWGDVRWALNGTPRNMNVNAVAGGLASGTTIEDDGEGKVRVVPAGSSLAVDFKIAKPTSHGDGTVPAESAWALDGHALFTAQMTGFEHQDSYGDQHVLDVTRYCVLRLVQREQAE